MNDIFTDLKEYPHICAGISERSDGSMVWWNQLPVDQRIRRNRDAYFAGIGIDPSRVVSGGLAHGVRVAVVEEKDAGTYLPDTDALITDVQGIFISITGADCMPIVYYDPVRKSVGIAHAGWRGLVSGIAENVIREMGSAYGSRPEDIVVAYGPHIGACHLEVGEDVASRFEAENVLRRRGHLYASLANEATTRLERLGVERIHPGGACTYCLSDRFYSARCDKEEPLKGMAAYIGLRKQ